MNPAPKVAPAGSWRSPIAAEVLASAGLRLAGIALDGERAWWAEGRPAEGGRVVLVRESASGGTEDVLPAPWSARSKVHEYGGGAFAVSDGVAWLVNESDQRVYEWREGKTARALTPDGPWRYADLQPDPARGRLLCVREDHSGGDEPANALVAVDLAGGGVRVLAEGHDFYAAPRVAPDGNRLAFLAWDHPHMPRRGARVWLACRLRMTLTSVTGQSLAKATGAPASASVRVR